MGYRLSKKSRDKLTHVHPDLVLVVGRAIQITEVDFTVLEGARTAARQKALVEQGASRTLNSRHLKDESGICYAVDLGAYVAGSVRWDWPLYHKIAAAMKQAATELGILIEWGGDWRTFKDGPHFQLPHKFYKQRK